MKSKIIKVGIDFDGVLAYNPFRVVRAPVTYVKRSFLGMKKTKFYIPKTDIERWIWTVLHESSVFPAKGTGLLKDLVKDGHIEAHLVTARYSFLQQHLEKWLTKHNMRDVFTSITLNTRDEQPHKYKARIIGKQKFDYFIEDNYDIVSEIHGKNNTKVLWIYNILDRWYDYPHKYPYLEKALQAIKK